MDRKKRDALIMQYAPLVKSIVDRIASKVPSHIADREDLMNVGIIGLMSALEKFDKTRNAPFESYARYRIRGAVLDELRSRDWLSRSTRNKHSRLEEAFYSVQKELGRPPEDEEVAVRLGLTLEQYYELLDEAKSIYLLSSEDLPPDYEHTESQGTLSGKEHETPHSLLFRKELRNVLKGAIDELPERERLVLALYYYEELTMKEIGVVMNVTESRVCQLHSKAVLRLRGELRELRLG